MPYQLTNEAWLNHQAARARGILLQQMERGREYTVNEVLDLLREFGLDYSNPEYQAIGPLLVADGLIENVS